MFRKKEEIEGLENKASSPAERITTVLGDGINYTGKLSGRGGVRIESAFEGEISLNGLLVVGLTGRITCEEIHATTVVVAGAVRGNIIADKVEIRKSGRVWGNVTALAFSTEEGAFLRGNIQMEEKLDLAFSNATEENEKNLKSSE